MSPLYIALSALEAVFVGATSAAKWIQNPAEKGDSRRGVFFYGPVNNRD